MVIYAAGAAGTIALIAGILVLRIGRRRSRRVGVNVPYCTDCSYPMIGLVGVTTRCPECGVSLEQRPPRHGHTRWAVRRARYAGVALILAGTSALGCTGRWLAKNVEWYQSKPCGLVLADAQAGQQRGFDELARRIKNRKLTRSGISLVAAAALDQQAQGEAPSLASWLGLLEDLNVSGLWAWAECDRFYRQSIWSDVHVGRRIRAGHPIPVVVSIFEANPWTWESRNRTSVSSYDFLIGSKGWQTGRPYRFDPPPYYVLAAPVRGYARGWREIYVVPAMSELGKQGFECRMHYTVDEKEAPGFRSIPQAFRTYYSSHIRDVEFIDPASDEGLIAVENEDLRLQVMSCVSLVYLRPVDRARPITLEKTTRPLRNVEFKMVCTSPPPIGLAYDVYFVKDGVEYLGGRFMASPVGWSRCEMVEGGFQMPVLAGDRFKAVLRPSAAVAKDTPDVFEYWAGELVIRGEEVRLGGWEPPSERLDTGCLVP